MGEYVCWSGRQPCNAHGLVRVDDRWWDQRAASNSDASKPGGNSAPPTLLSSTTQTGGGHQAVPLVPMVPMTPIEGIGHSYVILNINVVADALTPEDTPGSDRKKVAEWIRNNLGRPYYFDTFDYDGTPWDYMRAVNNIVIGVFNIPIGVYSSCVEVVATIIEHDLGNPVNATEYLLDVAVNTTTTISNEVSAIADDVSEKSVGGVLLDAGANMVSPQGIEQLGVTTAQVFGPGLAARAAGAGAARAARSAMNAGGVVEGAGNSLGNPFKNSTLTEVQVAFERHVQDGKLTLEYANPASGARSYSNKKSGYSYNIDPGGTYGGKVEGPHIDVNYPKPKPKRRSKKKLPVKDEK